MSASPCDGLYWKVDRGTCRGQAGNSELNAHAGSVASAVATSPRPWIATTMFKMAESEVHVLKLSCHRESSTSKVRSGGWKHIEDLRAAVQAHKDFGEPAKIL